MHPIIQRLKERKLVQWGVAYLAGAVALYSALDAFAEPWGVGDLQLRIAQVALLVGFFIALTLAWYHGELGQQRISRRELLVLSSLLVVGVLSIRAVAFSTRSDRLMLNIGERVQRSPDPFPPSQKPSDLSRTRFDLSADGSTLVYTSIVDHESMLMVRHSDDLAAEPLVGTVRARNPAVSPSGAEVAFDHPDGPIQIASLDGPSIRTSIDGVRPEWGPDGTLYVTVEQGLMRIPEGNGEPVYVSRLGPADERHTLFDVLPTGRHALIEVAMRGGADEIRILDLSSGEMESLIQGGQRPEYVATGHLIYFVAPSTMMGVRFDARARTTRGDPVMLIEGVRAWSVADDGTLFYSTSTSTSLGAVDVGYRDRVGQMLWADRSGQTSPVDADWLVPFGNDDAGWSLSPDGSSLAIRERTNDGYDVFVKRLDDGPRVRITHDATDDRYPTWINGGRDLSVVSNYDVWVKPADGSGNGHQVLNFERFIVQAEWQPDDSGFLFRTTGPRLAGGGRDIYQFRNGADALATPFIADPSFDEMDPSISPSGEYVAYASAETGRFEIVVRPMVDVASSQYAVSSDGGSRPRWSADGRELFFQSAAHEMMVAEVRTQPDFEVVGSPRVLFESRPDWLWITNVGVIYDVSSDGSKFVIARVTDLGSAPEEPNSVLVTNWFTELRERMGEGN